MGASRRDHLVETALKLFCRDGYQATGIDKILAEAGCAKMTLYNHFKSKDELILAALHRRDEQFRNAFMRAIERQAGTPRERLSAIFDVLQAWFEAPDFSGCMFINASAEFGDPDDPIHAAAAEHKRLILGYFRQLAEGLMLLMEGAIVMRHVAGQADAARRARASAQVLIDQALS